MAQFLSEAFDGTLAEIMQLNRNKDFDDKKAVTLLSQLSILGMLKDLPYILKLMKDQMNQEDKKIQSIRSNAIDPLAKETEDGL